jgi:tRNA modification GTPase
LIRGRSYTGSDTLEICPHGNPLIVELILKDLIDRGCRIAQAGEFTKNAFLAGKIDLTQAEAVAKIINASSKAELKIANNNLRGKLSSILVKYQEEMIDLKAKFEAYLDFPEEDIPQQRKRYLEIRLKLYMMVLPNSYSQQKKLMHLKEELEFFF